MLQFRIRGPDIFFFWVFGVVVVVLKRLQVLGGVVAINQFREERHGRVVAWALSFSSGFGFTPGTHCLHTIAGVTVHFQCLHWVIFCDGGKVVAVPCSTGGNEMPRKMKEY